VEGLRGVGLQGAVNLQQEAQGVTAHVTRELAARGQVQRVQPGLCGGFFGGGGGRWSGAAKRSVFWRAASERCVACVGCLHGRRHPGVWRPHPALRPPAAAAHTHGLSADLAGEPVPQQVCGPAGRLQKPQHALRKCVCKWSAARESRARAAAAAAGSDRQHARLLAATAAATQLCRCITPVSMLRPQPTSQHTHTHLLLLALFII
jgi:hypothetical protein